MQDEYGFAELRSALLEIQVVPAGDNEAPCAVGSDRGIERKALRFGRVIQAELVGLSCYSVLR